VQSIRDNGLYRNIVVAKEGTVLAGHGVLRAVRKLGMEEIPVVRLDLEPDDPRALKVLTGDNEIEHLSEQDDRLLSQLLKEVRDDDTTNLLGTGYDDKMLSMLVMVTRPMKEIADFDAAAHWVGMPEFEPELSAHPKFTVNFRTEEDKQSFLKKTGLKQSGQNSAWWPPKEKDDRKAFLFESE